METRPWYQLGKHTEFWVYWTKLTGKNTQQFIHYEKIVEQFVVVYHAHFMFPVNALVASIKYRFLIVGSTKLVIK